jgi:hypothetical protein
MGKKETKKNHAKQTAQCLLHLCNVSLPGLMVNREMEGWRATPAVTTLLESALGRRDILYEIFELKETTDNVIQERDAVFRKQYHAP